MAVVYPIARTPNKNRPDGRFFVGSPKYPGVKKAWLRGHARWLAKTTRAGLWQARESPHDETYLVKISLPSLVDWRR